MNEDAKAEHFSYKSWLAYREDTNKANVSPNEEKLQDWYP